MEFKYTKTKDNIYQIEGVDFENNINSTFLTLYNRLDRAVNAYGLTKTPNGFTVLEYEQLLKEKGMYKVSEQITTLRKTRNLLVHSEVQITVNKEMIIQLIKILINVEEFMN